MATIPKIEYPILCVRFGGNSVLPNDCFRSFDYVCDEDSILPKCLMRFTDQGNSLFKSYWGLETGSKVEVVVSEGSATPERIAETDTSSYSVELGNLTVGAVYSNETNTAVGADGYLEVKCVHPWEVFQDLTAHAYAGKSNSEIIKGLIENSSTRGFKFNDIDSNIFNDTDENGDIPRYKCGEGDLDFIVNKLLPYTTINNLPPCFFIDDKNNVHLETFQSMFVKDAKLLIVGGNDEDVTEEQKLKASMMNGLAIGSELVVKVGNEAVDEYTKIIKREVSFDDPSSLSAFTGKLLPKIAIGKFSMGSNQSGYIPVSAAKVLLSDATDKVYYRNHNFKDLKAIALNDQKPFNSFFKIEINTTFCGHLISVGDNVELDIPAESGEKNWLNGKWHIKAIRYRVDPSHMLLMRLTLIRPSFLFNENSTTLMNPTDFYAIGTGA